MVSINLYDPFDKCFENTESVPTSWYQIWHHIQAFADYRVLRLNPTTADGINIRSLSQAACELETNQILAHFRRNSTIKIGLDLEMSIYDDDVRNGSIEYLRNMTERRAEVMSFVDVIEMHP